MSLQVPAWRALSFALNSGMLLTIDLKGKTINALAGLLDVESKQIQTKEMYFGKAHAWALRPGSEKLELRCMLDVHSLDVIPEDKPYLTSGALMGKFIHPRAHIAHTALSNAILEIYQVILDQANELPWLARPLEITCTLPPLLGSEEVFNELFGKIGYTCSAQPLDAPQLFSLTLTGNFSLPRILWDLIMIVPALDIHRYYWTPEEPMNKILGRLQEYGPQHPAPALLEKAFRINYQQLYNTEIKRLARNYDPSEARSEDDQTAFSYESKVMDIEEGWEKIHNCLKDLRVKKLVLFNTNDPSLLSRLLPDEQFENILVLGNSLRVQQIIGQVLGSLDVPNERKAAVQLAIGSLHYRDVRVDHRDAVIIPAGFCELPPFALDAVVTNLFDRSKPSAVLILIPNAEYNSLIPDLPAGAKRHPRHQFEWDRKQISKWSKKVGNKFEYNIHTIPVGPEDPKLGPPAQLILFHHLSQL